MLRCWLVTLNKLLFACASIQLNKIIALIDVEGSLLCLVKQCILQHLRVWCVFARKPKRHSFFIQNHYSLINTNYPNNKWGRGFLCLRKMFNSRITTLFTHSEYISPNSIIATSWFRTGILFSIIRQLIANINLFIL